MRRLTTAPLVIGAALLAACSADPLNIIVTSARAPGDKCDFPDDKLYVSRGSVDFRPYAVSGGSTSTRTYYQVFSWQNNMSTTPISVGGQLVDPGLGNQFIADSAVYSYQYTDSSVVLANELQNMHAVISPGGNSTDNSVPANLIQPLAGTAIDKSALGKTAQTLLVTFQVFGKTLAGSSKNTNQVTFPLTIYRSDPTVLTCPTGQKIDTGVCGVPGRDAPVQCVTP